LLSKGEDSSSESEDSGSLSKVDVDISQIQIATDNPEWTEELKLCQQEKKGN